MKRRCDIQIDALVSETKERRVRQPIGRDGTVDKKVNFILIRSEGSVIIRDGLVCASGRRDGSGKTDKL